MKLVKKINLNKKFLAFIFTFFMIMSSFNHLPMELAYSTGVHNIKFTGAEEADGNLLVYKVNGCKAGTIKLNEIDSSFISQDDSYALSGISSGSYTVTITCLNGYLFNGLKINGESHSSKECNKVTNNIYTYNLNLSGKPQDIIFESEFQTNISSSSTNKLYIGDTLCIDETSNPPITQYEGKDFSVFPSEEQGSYTISMQPGALIESVLGEGEIGVIIKTNGSGSISLKDDYSIKGVKNLTICDIKNSPEILTLKGGIQASNLIKVQKNTSIGTQNTPSPKGISGANDAKNKLSVLTEYANLELYTSETCPAFENVSGEIISGSRGNIYVISNGKAFENAGKVIVRDGGYIEILSKVSELNTKAYSHWINSQNHIYESSSSLAYSKQEVQWNSSTENSQENFYYEANQISEPSSSGYYKWSLKSLSNPMSRLIYGKNTSGEATSLIQGDVKIISGNGVKYDGSSKIGQYDLQSGCEVRISLMPKYGFQLNKTAIQNLSMTPQENKGEYTFVMPDQNVLLEELFTKNNDKININSSHIKSAQINVKEGLINGNAELTIKPLSNPENSSDFEKTAGKFNIMGYFDISLDEVIFKNGDAQNGYWKTNITELSEPMEITLNLSDNLKGKKSYCILREHNGKISNLGGIYDVQGSKLKFSTNQYSSYAVGSSDSVRTLSTSVMYGGEEIKLIIEDPNNALSDDAQLEMTLVEEGSDRYNEIKNNLDDTYKPDNLAFFDIVIYKDDTKNEKYSKLDSKVNALLQIPTGWSKENLQAVLVSEGIDTDFDEEVVNRDGADYLSFWTDHFSPYAFLDELSESDLNDIYNQALNQNTNTPTTEEENNNDNNDLVSFITGDKYRTIIIVAAAAVIISVILLVVLRKKKK